MQLIDTLSHNVISAESSKLSQRGLGRSPSRNRMWCISALKYDIWWQK